MRGKPFTKGDPRAGRPKGAPNKTGRDARLLAQSLVTDEAYVEKLKQRLLDGKLDGALERMLWAYAFGSPPDKPVTTLYEFMESSLPYQPPDEQ